jgi:hypothetical protein
MTGLQETGIVSGTKDKDYNLMSYVQSCLKNALRMEVYRKDAERDNDQELIELFTKAQAESRKGAEIGKKLLATRLTGVTPAQPVGGGATEGGEPPPADVMAAHPDPAE